MRRSLVLVLAIGLAAVAVSQPPKAAWPVLKVNDAKLATTAKGLPAPVVGVAWVESKGLLVAACGDGSLHAWTRQDGKDWLAAKPQAVKAHAKAVTALVAVGDLLASASTDGKVHLWAVPVAKPARTLAPGSIPRSLAASPDGKTLAIGCEDGSVRLNVAATGAETRKLAGPADWMTALAFSPDGKLLAGGGPEGKLWLWETATGKKRFDMLAQKAPLPKAVAPLPNPVGAIAFSPDGKLILVGGADGNLYGFGLDGKLVRTTPAHAAGVTGLWWHPGNLLLASTSKDRIVQLWNATSFNKGKSLPGHDSWAEDLVGLAQGTELASAGADRTVRLWTLGAVKPKPKDKKK